MTHVPSQCWWAGGKDGLRNGCEVDYEIEIKCGCSIAAGTQVCCSFCSSCVCRHTHMADVLRYFAPPPAPQHRPPSMYVDWEGRIPSDMWTTPLCWRCTALRWVCVATAVLLPAGEQPKDALCGIVLTALQAEGTEWNFKRKGCRTSSKE